MLSPGQADSKLASLCSHPHDCFCRAHSNYTAAPAFPSRPPGSSQSHKPISMSTNPFHSRPQPLPSQSAHRPHKTRRHSKTSLSALQANPGLLAPDDAAVNSFDNLQPKKKQRKLPKSFQVQSAPSVPALQADSQIAAAARKGNASALAKMHSQAAKAFSSAAHMRVKPELDRVRQATALAPPADGSRCAEITGQVCELFFCAA